MDRTRFRRAQEIFQRAVTLALDVRHEFLNRECGADALLRADVEELLANDEAADATSLNAEAVRGELEQILLQSTEGGFDSEDAVPGFTILEPIGVGGMGVVFCAEQHEPRRNVALKVLRAGWSDALVRRFERETQLLARLDHPSIARLYAAGTTGQGLGEQDRATSVL